MPREIIHIVLIDDDDITNHIHQTVISSWEGERVSMKTYDEASEAIKELSQYKTSVHQGTDYIFLDINMPGMNGWQFLEAFEKLELNIPVFVLSSSINVADRERATSHNSVAGYITKPLNVDILEDLGLFN
ncbi:MAG: response regulator [Bacteroidota bacterium]